MAAFAVAAVALLPLAGQVSCDAGPARRPAVTVDHVSSLADQALRVRLSGLADGQRVEVAAESTDYQGVVWRGHAAFVADGDGDVDLSRALPQDGTYDQGDGMGLFWSMEPADGDADERSFFPRFPELAPAFEIHLLVTVDGREVASQTLRREWMSAGVTHRPVRQQSAGINADLYLPPPDSNRLTPVLLFGGSEGGSSQKFAAALLASHGHPAMSLAYFGAPGLPPTLTDIPLEYFATAARFLARQPGLRPGPVAVLTYSRGTEAALLLAHHYPDLFRGLILYAPSGTVGPSFPDTTGSAWTKDGIAIPRRPIPVARVTGPVLAVAGGDDKLWPSTAQARSIERHLRAANAASVEVLTYPDAGHGVGTYPFQPAGIVSVHPVDGRFYDYGGTRTTNAAARRDSWPQALALLATLT